MDLYSGEPYWLYKNGYNQSFPALTGDIQADVCVIGAGITGSLAAYSLAREGLDVVVLDKRHPGMGSTCASTALLQYEIDESLHELSQQVGRERAEQAYLACYQAIDAIQDIIRKENLSVEFRKSPSVQYASKSRDVYGLRLEYEARRRIDMDVRLLDSREVKDEFGFAAPAALWSSQGAQVDAYELAHGLLGLGLENVRVFDTIKVTSLQRKKKGILVETAAGHTVEVRNVVVTCGYESERFLPKRVLERSSTYALISKPVDPSSLWKDRTLIWETKTPYMYARTTADNRIIVGGRDDETSSRARRNYALKRKSDKIVADFHRLFPHIEFNKDFVWAGAFGSTKDSLAYVGSPRGMDGIYFILGFGGNGIVFSQTGSEIVRDAILGRKNPRSDLYSFSR